MKTMHALTIDFDLVEQSMRDLCRDSNEYFLNKRSGKVFALSRELIKLMVDITRPEEDDLPAWETKMVPIAREIILGGSSEFIRIPEAFGSPEHGWMIEFTETVRERKLKTRLKSSLKGRGCCVRFKEILRNQPDEMIRWNEYRSIQWNNKIQEWLEQAGIIAVPANPRRKKASAR